MLLLPLSVFGVAAFASDPRPAFIISISAAPGSSSAANLMSM